MQILLVDPYPIIHLGLEKSLASVFHSYNLTVAYSGGAAQKILSANTFDLLVIEIMLDDRNGLEVVRRMRSEGCKTPALVFTHMDEVSNAVRALRTGAQGILHKSADSEVLQSALTQVASGQRFVTGEVLNKLALEVAEGSEDAILFSLTGREREIFTNLAMGESISLIANKLCISYKTVYTHQVNILKKLHATSVQELTRHAFNNGIVPSRRVTDRAPLPDWRVK